MYGPRRWISDKHSYKEMAVHNLFFIFVDCGKAVGYAKLLLSGPICNLTAIQTKNLRKSCKKELLISEIFSIDKKCVFQTQKITEVWVWSACLVSIEKITSKISIFSSDLWEYWAYTGFLLRQCPFIGEFM